MNVDVCYVCRTQKIDPKTELLCAGCLKITVGDYKTHNEGGNVNGEDSGVLGGF
jgi:hypothetical protein